MTAREYAKITTETAFGVFPTTPPATVQAVLHLPQGNSQGVRGKPVHFTERSAGGSNRRVLMGSQQIKIGGKVSTKFFPSQGKILIPPAITLSGSPFDLGSFSLEHGIALDDGSSTILTRYLGCKVADFTLKASNSAAGTVTQIDYGLIAQSKMAPTSVQFAEPVYGTAPTYPADNPFLFQQTKGLLTIGGVRTSYSELTLHVQNKLRAPFDENQYVSSIRWSGRDVSMTAKLRYLSLQDRIDFEAVTKKTASLAFTDGTNTGTFAMNTVNFITDMSDDLPFDGEGYYQMLTIENFFDPTAGTVNDITYTQTP
jgi:hypothetical protein